MTARLSVCHNLPGGLPEFHTNPDRHCKDHPHPNVFHPEGPDRHAQAAEAKKACRNCPVRAECGTWALTTRQGWGIWGGMTVAERDELLKDMQGRRTETRGIG